MATQTIYSPGWRSGKEEEDTEEEEEKSDFSSLSYHGANMAAGTKMNAMVVIAQTVAVLTRLRCLHQQLAEALPCDKAGGSS